MTSYPYQPLKLPLETRILTLYPGKYDEDLQCRLSHMEIEASVPYDCLSYCWSKSVTCEPDMDLKVMLGPDPDSENEEPSIVRVGDLLGDPRFEFVYIRKGGVLPNAKIYCDNVEVTIGGELFRALRRVRTELTEPLRIWVDALCINQTDVAERNEHVKMMGKIYTNAAMVRIWLGESGGHERRAFHAFGELRKIINEESERLDGASRNKVQEILISHPQWYAIEWDAIAQFIGRAWFERIWVVQEIANAKDAVLYAGPAKMSWHSLFSLISTLRIYSMDQVIPHPFASKTIGIMGDLRKDRIKGELNIELLDLLEQLRHFKSTDPRDKLYGLVGLLNPDDVVEADYAKSSEQVFTDIAVQHLQSGSLNILCHCVESSHPKSLDLPSWVPDWTRPGWAEPLRIRGLKCTAAGPTKPQLLIDTTKGELRLKGRLLDTVSEIDDKTKIPAYSFNPDWTDADETDPKVKTKAHYMKSQEHMHEQWENMLSLAWPCNELFTMESYESMWRTFMCNRTRENEPLDADYGCAWEEVLATLAAIVSPDEPPLLGLMRPPFVHLKYHIARMAVGLGTSRDATTVRSAHLRWCYHRRFYESEAGRYGWAVDGAMPGDRVAVFYGCDYPFMIRDAGDGRYRIVGDCYIHGLMDGEALGEEFEEQEFILV